MSKLLLICRLLLFAAPLLLFVAPLSAQTNLTIPERLAADADGRFTTLLAALNATGLDAMLDGDAPYTLLAPTDVAFKTLADFLGESPTELLADTATLKRILLYHILPGRVFFRQLVRGEPFATALEGKTVQGKLANGFLVIGDAQASDVDQIAANGVIQVLGSVLVPADILPTAHLRVADFSPDSPGLDVYIDGGLTLFQAFGFP
ncbi:MAG: fasciclin domain-containing protein, partial [Chloroflexota bacterium]